MKSLTTKIFVIFLITASAALAARSQTVGSSRNEQAPSERAAAKKDLLELFEHCKFERDAETAGFFVYRGSEAERIWSDVYDFNNADDRLEVETVARELKKLLWQSDSYEFSEYAEKFRSKRQWHIWRVIFKRGGRQATVTFALTKIKGRYAIGDIDGNWNVLFEADN